MIKFNFHRLSGFIFLILFSVVFIIFSCKKEDKNNEVDVGYVNITIDPNSTQYLELNTVGGWLYLTANPPSRGIIVYRLSFDQFKAYERTPPSQPNECCRSNGICTRLIVDNPFVVDTCLSYDYLILDGTPQAPATKMLVEYRTFYDGSTLQITN